MAALDVVVQGTMDSVNAYAVVGPTNRQPPRFRSLAIAVDSSDDVMADSVRESHREGWASSLGSHLPKNAASEPNSSAILLA